MGNIMLGYDNLIEGAIVQDGSWLPTLPLANIKDRLLGLVARSNGLSLSATKLAIDVQPYNVVRLIDIVSHTLSLDAKYRIRSSAVSNFAVIGTDSGWRDVWPSVYPFGTLPWGAPNWWDGRPTVKQLAAQKAELKYILPEDCTDQFWLIEFDDQTNAAGYIDIGLAFIGPAWQPTTNASFGWGLGWEDPSEIDVSLSGAETPDDRPGYRVVRFSTDFMEEDEAFAQAFEIQRSSGVTRDVVVIWNPDDTVHALRRSFLGRLRKLDPIVNPYVSLNKTGWEVKERL